ncbi:APC10 [Hepatospora eriocheir]|uniref:APC10 n=1 Tax=Hepatospora eriocheir TaxID=1081669 RepID=A0A1X0QFM0_9MICR|nr:APC10 [Hepatospora eriocheir]
MYLYLSSFKKGYGLKELLSEDDNEYWSTDSVLPHGITITFNSKEYVYSVELKFSYEKDESYTPHKIEVSYNNSSYIEILNQPEGYVEFKIDAITDKIQIAILLNHTDGKDSHIHGIKVKKSEDKFFRNFSNKIF